MNQIDFSQIPLRDIHLPDAVGWWPPAVGWWILAGLVLIALAAFAWRYRMRFRERAALRTLQRVLDSLEQGVAPAVCLQRISMLMRRFAMSLPDAGSVPVAGLTGDRWLRYLDSRWPQDAFSEGPGRALAAAPYQPPERVLSGDVRELGALCVEWVTTQKKAEE
jgi:hypothetical protein